ncbi:SH3 domain-containing protein, partial [Terrilactibacillus laevilacticus]|uniref:SH3 domain-containing protein n=1 Tax=Terrilactibacillus laevilacticus TaxID=1380157 RepID=UPI0015EF69F2
MKKFSKLVAIAMAIFLIVSTIPPSISFAATTYTTTANLNVRSTPSTSKKAIGLLNKGSKLTVTGSSGSWLKIRYKNKSAYVFGKYVKKMVTSSPSSSFKKVNYLGYGADGIYIRATPNGKHLTTWAKNTPVTVVAETGNWLKIKYNNGYAYTYKTHVKKGNPPVAYKAYGKDYVYIRQTPNGKHLSTWPEGTSFNVYAQNGNWMVINYGNGYAYTYKGHVKRTPSSEKVLYKGTTTTNLVVRGTPSTKATKLTTLKKGTTVEVVRTGSWLKIKYKTGYAYVSGSYVKKPQTEKKVNYPGYGADGIYIRATPNGKHLTTWAKNTPVTVVAETGNWLKIKYNNGYAYTYKTHVKKGNPPVAYKAYG